jgi:HSP20 family protein
MPNIEIHGKGRHMPTRGWREWPSLSIEPFAWTPFGMMRRMMHQMDRALGGWPESFWPAIDVYEEKGNLNIRADMPGMKPEDVKIEVSDNSITLSGERKQEEEEHGEGYYHSERSYGAFHRTVPLPEGAETDKAKAEFHDGELKVQIPIPKGTAKGKRQIPISSGK